MAMTTRADTDDHIPEQLSLAGQDQVQVSITLPSPPGSLTKNLSQGSRLLALCCFTWPVSARGIIVPFRNLLDDLETSLGCCQGTSYACYP